MEKKRMAKVVTEKYHKQNGSSTFPTTTMHPNNNEEKPEFPCSHDSLTKMGHIFIIIPSTKGTPNKDIKYLEGKWFYLGWKRQKK